MPRQQHLYTTPQELRPWEHTGLLNLAGAPDHKIKSQPCHNSRPRDQISTLPQLQTIKTNLNLAATPSHKIQENFPQKTLTSKCPLDLMPAGAAHLKVPSGMASAAEATEAWPKGECGPVGCPCTEAPSGRAGAKACWPSIAAHPARLACGKHFKAGHCEGASVCKKVYGLMLGLKSSFPLK